MDYGTYGGHDGGIDGSNGARGGPRGPVPGRVVDVAARPVRVLATAQGVAADQPHETMVVVGLGDSLAEAEFLALTVPDARLLRDLLDQVTR